jgi:cis-L-3-hydroxyproline dehydratase
VINLTDLEKKMVDGTLGEGTALAMSIMVKLGEAFDAEKMVPIASSHIDGAIYRYEGEVCLVFAEKLAALGAKVRVPTTLSMGSRDIARWKELRMSPEFAEGCRRMEDAYAKMGAIPAWTCAPYLQAVVPRFGEHVAWAESNAIVYANSVLGARTARYGDLADICAAIAGRVPYVDLHRTENRHGKVHLKFNSTDEIDFSDDSIYPVIGYAVGKLAPDGIPVLEGIPATVSTDQLKNLGAAAASSGNVALFHIVGVTPEARSLSDALGGRPPERVVEVSQKDLVDIRQGLSTTEDKEIDFVTIGCPHASYMEMEKIHRLLSGEKIARGVEFWITTNRSVYGWLEDTGLLRSFIDSGVKILTDTCFFTGNYLENWDFHRVATNSAKFAHYAPMGKKMEILFGSTEQCVRAALSGGI